MANITRIKTGGRKPGVQNRVSREIRAAAMVHAEGALDVLVGLMTASENDQVKLAAAKELLDRACGRTADSIQVQRYEHADEQRGKPPQTIDEMMAEMGVR